MMKYILTLSIALVPSFAAADDKPNDKPAAAEASATEESAADEPAAAAVVAAKPLPTTDDKPTDVPVAKDDGIDDSKDPTAGIAAKYPVDGEEWLNADPLLIIDTEMNTVVTDMRDGQLFRPHSTTQPRIIARFDKLIEMLERKKTGLGSASPNSAMPAGISGIREGGAEAGELTAKDDKTGAMDKLPPNQRKKIQQASADGFPPGFEDVLSDYFRRLAETKTAE